MKILCVADHVDPLVYSASVKERYADVDLVLGAGDLPMSYLGFIASSLNKPVLFVFGNHNLEEMHRFKRTGEVRVQDHRLSLNLQHSFGSTYVDRRSVRVKNLLIAGLGGSARYNNGDNQYTERQMWWRAVRLAPKLLFNRLIYGRYLDILLTHAAPYGIHDKPDRAHVGFRSFLWLMRTFKPRYLIHGHIHLYDLNAQRETQYEDTLVINVYDHYILEIEAPE
ncbi:MAG: metallophosphoesterase [Spirochaetaceae bacterium]